MPSKWDWVVTPLDLGRICKRAGAIKYLSAPFSWMLLLRVQESARAGNGKGRLPWRTAPSCAGKWPIHTDPPFFVTSAMPWRIKLDIQGGKREGERERGRAREGGRERREKRLRQEYISYVWIRGRIRGNCLLFSLFSAAKQRFIECLQRSLSFFFSF